MTDHVPLDRQIGQCLGLRPELLRGGFHQELCNPPRRRREFAAGPTYFVTATKVTSAESLPTRLAASAIRRRTSATFSASCSAICFCSLGLDIFHSSAIIDTLACAAFDRRMQVSSCPAVRAKSRLNSWGDAMGVMSRSSSSEPSSLLMR